MFVLKFIIILTRNFIFCKVHLFNFQQLFDTHSAEDDDEFRPRVEEMERDEPSMNRSRKNFTLATIPKNGADDHILARRGTIYQEH